MLFKRHSESRDVDSTKASSAEFERVAVPELSNIYRGAIYLTKDRDAAEDLVQETFARAFRFFDKFEPGTNCRAWLLTIMRNLFYTHYRRNQEELELMDSNEIDQTYEFLFVQPEKTERDNPASSLISESMDDEVDRALKELPEEFRTTIVLVDIEELSYEEAAGVMEVPIGTVRSRISRGRRLLQVALHDYAKRNRLIND